MFKGTPYLASMVLAGSMLALAPAAAQDVVVRAHSTFRDLEYGYQGQERLDRASAALSARIPAGTPISAARATVTDEGAHCGAATDDGQTRCIFTGFAADNEHLHDIVWTVRLNSRGGRIVDFNVARKSVGA